MLIPALATVSEDACASESFNQPPYQGAPLFVAALIGSNAINDRAAPEQ
jgi:hypothetical protein